MLTNPRSKLRLWIFCRAGPIYTRKLERESGGMAWVEIPTPVALLGGLMMMALSAHYMTARSKTG